MDENMSDKYGESCPCCGTKWKIASFGAKIWKDCLKCGDTAENLVAKASENTSSSSKCPVNAKYHGADWLKDWAEEYHGPWSQSYSLPVNKDADEDDVDNFGDLPFLRVTTAAKMEVLSMIVNKGKVKTEEDVKELLELLNDRI